ncbi:MAG: hypothetical protein PHS37_04505 [Candidatus Omnitrophica bacterium]|nr:hypothetical protein [Candidatus Omnitrophota bacterium]
MAPKIEQKMWYLQTFIVVLLLHCIIPSCLFADDRSIDRALDRLNNAQVAKFGPDYLINAKVNESFLKQSKSEIEFKSSSEKFKDLPVKNVGQDAGTDEPAATSFEFKKEQLQTTPTNALPADYESNEAINVQDKEDIGKEPANAAEKIKNNSLIPLFKQPEAHIIQQAPQNPQQEVTPVKTEPVSAIAGSNQLFNNGIPAKIKDAAPARAPTAISKDREKESDLPAASGAQGSTER